jgi:hypothetical protein
LEMTVIQRNTKAAKAITTTNATMITVVVV